MKPPIRLIVPSRPCLSESDLRECRPPLMEMARQDTERFLRCCKAAQILHLREQLPWWDSFLRSMDPWGRQSLFLLAEEAGINAY